MLAEERVVTPEGKETHRTEWFYEPESFVPLAKREAGGGAGVATKGSDGGAEEVRLWYVVTDHLGTPREMLSEDGSLVWAAEYTTWGSVRRLWQADNDDNSDGNFQGTGPDGNPVYSTRVYGTSGNTALKPAQTPDAYACPIRFQGQWADEETGLYYNRFRYYDPDAAQYMSSDPIGIAGGLRSQGYVEQPSCWVDPFGLNGFTPVPLLEGTVYRMGSGTLGSLTPRVSDLSSGLSTLATHPTSPGNFVGINVSKLRNLQVIQDGPNHVSIRPKPESGYTMEDWAKAKEQGGDHPLSKELEDASQKYKIDKHGNICCRK